jgi:hypothetical protein
LHLVTSYVGSRALQHQSEPTETLDHQYYI